MSRSMDPAVLHSFLEEVRGYLPMLECEVDRLRAGGDMGRTLEEVHRLVHSIRSASEMIGLAQLAEAARGVEQLVAPVMFGEVNFPPTIVSEVQRGLEAMRGELDASAAELPAAAGAPNVGELAPPDEMLAAALAAEAPADSSASKGLSAGDIPDFDPVAEDLVGTFAAEADQLLESMDRRLDQWRRNPPDAPLVLPELRQSAHTLKGAAAMAGLDTTASLAHRMEDLLELLCAGKAPAEPEVLDLLQATHDCLAELVAARGDNRAMRDRVLEIAENYQALLSLLEEVAPAEAPPEEPEKESQEIHTEEETDSFLLDTFLEEAEACLAEAENALRTLEGRPADPAPSLTVLRRSVHTLKGAAGMVGLMTASNLARRLQAMLDAILAHTIPYGHGVPDLLAAATDLLNDLISAQGRNAEYVSRVEEMFARIDRVMSGASAEEEPPPVKPTAAEQAFPATTPAPRAQEADTSQLAVRVPVEKLDAVGRIIGEIFVNATAVEQQVDGLRHELEELTLNLARMRRISAALAETQAEEAAVAGDQAAPAHEATSSASEFDVLEFDRYTRMHLLSRDLAEATSDLSALSAQLQAMRSQLDSWAARQRGLSGEAQDKLMRLRMVPLSSLASRLARTVRVTASKTGKVATLVTEGLETEFDKTVVEQLGPALEHLLRNAVDHGIEPPTVRAALGKPETGTICLTAARHGAHVAIQLKDDGAGINFDKIRKRAVQIGWLTAEEAAGAEETALSRLILEPGFSTAETVSEISGRGVGMDIVRTTVESLRGRLTIHSTPGRGATFTLLLPVSMAVDKVMIVEAGGQRFAVPMASFSRPLRPSSGEVFELGGLPHVEADGASIPLVRLADWLGLASVREEEKGTLLFIDNGEREVALEVDRVFEGREVVVKPLTSLLAQLTRYAGATILGDGSVVLILNPSAVDPSPEMSLPMTAVRRPPAQEVEVLVVDDSISIRRSLANLLRSAGWRSVQARDGVEAIELLERAQRLPAVILMDIEMPRMDGYELTAKLRSQREFDETPIIMLTSRAGEKHRQKAMRLGVDGYLVKPCPDDLLVSEVGRWIQNKRRPAVAAS